MDDAPRQLLPRFLADRVTAALKDTPVVMVNGPRQCGKTTLVRDFVSGERTYITLDDDTVLEGVRADPVGFIRGLDVCTIDEVQRAPDLLRAIKRSVDQDRRPGRFLLTGSANVLTLPTVSESLAGRIEVLTLLPLSRTEIRGKKPGFLRKAFAGALVRQLTNFTQIGGQNGLDDKTTKKYMAIFEQLFLVRRLEPWFRNWLKRLVKTPKLHFLDSGLLAAILGITAERIVQDRTLLGPLLEAFVFSEVLKQGSGLDETCTLFHYRDKDQDEVDIVIENEAAGLVGIEIKAAATVNAGDFKGLRKLADAARDNLKLGIVLYDGDSTVPFGDRMFAAPVPCLWG